jgi:hypothetical protein
MMNLEFNGGSLLLKNKTRLSLQAGSDLLSSDFDYKLVQITSTVNWRIARWLKTDWRFYGGIIDGQPALQDRFYLYGGVEPQGPLSPLVDGRGRYSAHQRLQLPEEGGGLRGYYGRFLSGNRITSLNFELSMPNSLVKLFFDAGNVWEANDSSAPAKWRYDAGIRVNIGPLALHFPFWISDPLPGEDALEFRWLISLPASSITLGI